MTRELPDVRVGQVWCDNDRRSTGRTFEVVQIVDGPHLSPGVKPFALVASGPLMRRTRIRLERFRPTSTGYRLVTDVLKETS